MGIRWAKVLGSLSSAEEAANDGFESIQVEVGLLSALSDAQLLEIKDQLQRLGLSIAVCTAPLPSAVSITEKGFNTYVWIEYLNKAVRAVAELGCNKIAWNDGRARLLPLEGDTSTAKQQALQFLAMLCDASAPYDITVLLEPLDPRRTNFLNTMEEVADFIARVGRENLSSMISLRDLEGIGMKDLDFDTYANLINHVQLENPRAATLVREPPRSDDGFDYRPFLRSLRRINYQGAITLPKDTHAKELSYCEDLWEQVG